MIWDTSLKKESHFSKKDIGWEHSIYVKFCIEEMLHNVIMIFIHNQNSEIIQNQKNI